MVSHNRQLRELAALVTFGFRRVISAWVVLGGSLAGWLLAQL